MPPQAIVAGKDAWSKAKEEKRHVLRPFQPDPWWKYL